MFCSFMEDDDSVINISFSKKQEEFLEAVFSQKYVVLLFGGAIRGGKTYCLLWYAQMMCIFYPGIKWLVVRKSMTEIQLSVYPALEQVVIKSRVKRHIKANGGSRLIYKNGSVIYFKGENYNQNKNLPWINGLQVNGIILEEVDELQEQTFNRLLPRRNTWKIPGIKKKDHPQMPLLCCCNPSWNWVKDLFYTPHKLGTLNEKFFYLQSRVYDNTPFLESFPNFIEDLKSTIPKYEFEVKINGNWDYKVKEGNEFFKAFDPDRHIKKVSINIDLPFHISIDNNVFPYIAVTIWQIENIEGKWQVRQVHEIPCKDPKNTASGAGKEVAKWLKSVGNYNTVHVYGDPTTQARNTIDENKKTFLDKFVQEIDQVAQVRKCMFNAAPPVASTGDFINAIYDMEWGGLSIVIGEHCKESIGDYIDTKEDRDGTILKKRVTDAKTGISYEKHGHMSDTKRYFIVKCFNSEYNKYKNRFNNFDNIRTSSIGGFAEVGL